MIKSVKEFDSIAVSILKRILNEEISWYDPPSAESEYKFDIVLEWLITDKLIGGGVKVNRVGYVLNLKKPESAFVTRSGLLFLENQTKR